MALKDLRNQMQVLADPDRAKINSRFFKTGSDGYCTAEEFIGIRIPELRKLVKEHAPLPLEEVEQLLQSEIHEERFIALLFMVDQYGKGNEKTKKAIYDLYLANLQWVNNWDLIDTSADKIVGAYHNQRSRKLLYKFARSKSLWERRIAILASFDYIRNNDFQDTLQISEILLQEEDLIHKAVGWMLREVGKRDRDVLDAFLRQHYQIMPRTMLRYAIEKHPETVRKQYLQGKI